MFTTNLLVQVLAVVLLVAVEDVQARRGGRTRPSSRIGGFGSGGKQIFEVGLIFEFKLHFT